MGGVVRKKNNANSRQTEMARLSQLGDLLGMDQAEIMASQSDLAEQAYKAQVNCSGGGYSSLDHDDLLMVLSAVVHEAAP